MRRKISIKLKLTLWFTCFMTLIAAGCLVLILLISNRMTENQAVSILSLTVRGSIPEVSLSDGKLNISENFKFYVNDVYLLLYSKNKSLLSGQVPPFFPVEAELENGVAKFIAGEEDDFYVLDFWIPSGWEDGVWLRGVLKSPDSRRIFGNIFDIFFIILPFFLLVAAAGGYFIVKRTLNPISRITDAARNISGGRDLTKRIGIPSSNDEVSRLANAFDHMFERLERSFEAEKQFTSDASHELRTPTTVILAQCSYAKKHASSLEEYQEAITVIDRQAKRMSLLIERLLDMTRLDLGTQKLVMETVNLSEMARVLCEEQDTGLRGISIVPWIDEGITIQADPFLISRVITNLLDNARKYGKEGGHIFFRLSSFGSVVVLEVEDDGIGMEAKELDKIWKRFYQVGDSRESDSGLGLGLSMVQQIVELHGGKIIVESIPGCGSCFTVKLQAVSEPGWREFYV